MSTRAKVALGLVAGMVVGSVLMWGSRTTRPGGPAGVPALHVPAPETLGIVLPPEPIGRPPRREDIAGPSGNVNRGLNPPTEEIQRLSQDGAVLY
ncbi:MAG: hypothetical protein HY600_02690 [Candidatus Omnitrophica bacterium]|nr:hypothetical protein [Candidatus Omnitrophota bacterium]